MKLGFSKKQYLGILGVSAIALLALQPVNTFGKVAGFVAGPAHAEGHDESSDDHGGGKGGKGGTGGSGGSDDHSHDDTTSDDHDHEDGAEDDHDYTDGGSGKGPKAGSDHGEGSQGEGAGGDGGKGKGGSGGKDSAGKRPVWAKEGIPEVELGRLNVVRSPSHVLDRAYAEALSEFTIDKATFYSLPLDQALAKLRAEFSALPMIDSPLQNLALLRDALDGSSVLTTLPQVTNSNDTLMALFLGTASDKNIPVTPETAYSVALMLGYELSESSATSLATQAEAVRQAVLEGHG